jgi:hypothetical protein
MLILYRNVLQSQICPTMLRIPILPVAWEELGLKKGGKNESQLTKQDNLLLCLFIVYS